MQTYLTKLSYLAGASLLLLTLSPSAWASSAGATVLPYEAWLAMFQKSLTGPVAFSISLIGIIASGSSLILMGGEISSFFRTVIYIIFVMALLVGANSLMTNFFNGASINLSYQQTTLVDSPTTPQRRLLEQEFDKRYLYDYQATFAESALA